MRVCANFVAMEKSINITHSECVSVAFRTHHAMRMRRVLLSPVACLTRSYVFTLPPKRHDFRTGAGKLLNVNSLF